MVQPPNVNVLQLMQLEMLMQATLWRSSASRMQRPRGSEAPVMQDNADVEPGELWAYRARQVDELVEVQVLRLGTQRPARVLVRFVGDAFEGREEWVPPARLKVPWQNVAPFRDREQAWDRVREAGIPDDDSRVQAAEQVFELLFDNEDVSVWYREAGALRVADPGTLAARLGLDAREMTDHPLAFTDGDALTGPWEVTELVATTAARLNPDPILEFVASEERQAAREAIHGRWWQSGRRGNDSFWEPEDCVEFDLKYYRARRELMRSWCGADAINRVDELTELRKEIRRVGLVAEAAIKALRAAGHRTEAARLEDELSTPVEMLRT